MRTSKLRLGPLPKTEPVKLTVTLSAELKATLDRYATLHAQTYGERVDAAALVPHMLDAFMTRDRAFRKIGSSRRPEKQPAPSSTTAPGVETSE